MSTTDVPGAKTINRDVLDVGCWAEHDDGSLIFVEGVEDGTVVYSVFDVSVDPPIEFRDALSEKGFKQQFTWDPKAKDSLKWTWHDKTRFDWSRVMQDFPAGTRYPSASAQLNAAQRVARSLHLRGEAVTRTGPARGMLTRLNDALSSLRK